VWTSHLILWDLLIVVVVALNQLNLPRVLCTHGPLRYHQRGLNTSGPPPKRPGLACSGAGCVNNVIVYQNSTKSVLDILDVSVCGGMA
jgi:hypothetical protein